MKKVKLTVLGLLFSILVYSQNENPSDKLPAPPPAELQIIANEQFSIQYPDYWQANESGLMGSTFILFSPLSSPEDDFRENINFMIQDLKGLDIDLDRFTEISVAQIETMVTDGIIIQNEKIQEDSTSFQKIIYTGKQGIYDLKFEQFYFVHEEKAFILTLTCKASEFEAYKEEGEAILKSFQFIESKAPSKSKKI